MTSQTDILVTIPQGTLKGKKEESPYGNIYYSFQGIPFGKPPVGELRFKAAQPADGWTGVRDATEPGGTSPCLDYVPTEEKKFMGSPKLFKGSSEDCLYINVITKHTPKSGQKYPVIVNIHGGGYTIGSGNKEFAGPDYLIAHDIVYVSFNYRLGALGFLSLKTLDCPGNYGLKDQRLALQWIQNNIAYFGGDPDNVTIMGVSAGGSSVHNLTLSPSCKGLFKRAIAQSGASTNSWGYSLHPRETAYLLAKRLGFDASNDEELLEFLRKAPVEDIVIKSAGIWTEVEGSRIGEEMLNFGFCPTPEPESDEAILPFEPMTKGNQLDVPLITGVTDREMVMSVNNPSMVPNWTQDKDFQDLIPRELNVPRDSELSLKLAKKIREFFFKNGEPNAEGLADALSDNHFANGVYRGIRHRLANKNLKSPTYAYVFSYEAKSLNMRDITAKFFHRTDFSVVKGNSHGADVPYFFLADWIGHTGLKPGTEDYKLSQQLVKMWVDFATTGQPTNKNSEINWPPTTAEKDVYLDIGNEIKVKEGFFKDRMEFWDVLYRLAGREPYLNN